MDICTWVASGRFSSDWWCIHLQRNHCDGRFMHVYSHFSVKQCLSTLNSKLTWLYTSLKLKLTHRECACPCVWIHVNPHYIQHSLETRHVFLLLPSPLYIDAWPSHATLGKCPLFWAPEQETLHINSYVVHTVCLKCCWHMIQERIWGPAVRMCYLFLAPG